MGLPLRDEQGRRPQQLRGQEPSKVEVAGGVRPSKVVNGSSGSRLRGWEPSEVEVAGGVVWG